MKHIIVISAAMALLLTVGLANAKGFEITKKSGDYAVQIKIDKNPPVTGENKMDIIIKDAEGKDVAEATVVVDYGMPAMPGMPAMNYKAKADLKGGRYTSTLNFSMSGAWTINIKIAKAGKTQSVKLNVDVK
jgi:hypothetical protein